MATVFLLSTFILCFGVLWYELKHSPNEKELWGEPEFKGERYKPAKKVA